MMLEKKIFQPLTSKHICEVYALLHSEGVVAFPLTNSAQTKLESLVANVTGANFDVDRYKTIEEKIVAYFYFIIKDHPFVDGNKRTAALVFLVLCRMNNVKTSMPGYGLDALAVFLEQQAPTNHQRLISLVAKTVFSR
jgi:prophage maintenance system killer protein